MIDNAELYIHKGLAELGPTQFLEALSSVCMGISESSGNTTDAEKAGRNQWLFLSAQAAKLKRNMEKAGLTCGLRPAPAEALPAYRQVVRRHPLLSNVVPLIHEPRRRGSCLSHKAG